MMEAPLESGAFSFSQPEHVMYRRIKKAVWELTEKNTDKDPYYEIFNGFIFVLIILNITAIVLESFAGFHAAFAGWFHRFEVVSVAVFTVEYLMRLWVADMPGGGAHPVADRLRYLISPMALVDLAAITPFYLPMFLHVDLRFLRILRLMRVFRIFKITRYTRSVDIIISVFRMKKADLIVTLLASFFVVLVSSTIMFYVEHDAQPEVFPNIVAAFWWAVATLTTVGYGDVYPVTAAGKVISGVIAVVGIGLVALPTGIVSSGFIDELHRKRSAEERRDQIVCPHCGKRIDRK
jgi:voltage-gated potassium channel